MNSVRTSKAIPVPVEKPAPMGVKAMGYNRPGGFETFQALLSECGKATCEACSESQITTDRGLAQVNASLRNKYVRGQTLPTKKSFLGTFFRAGDINDKAALAYRGEDWGVLAEDIECDRKKRANDVVLGSEPTACTGKNGNVGTGYDGGKRAYHNRWYLNQSATPGTPLWPTGKLTPRTKTLQTTKSLFVLTTGPLSCRRKVGVWRVLCVSVRHVWNKRVPSNKPVRCKHSS